jgi:hypothetical protein
MVYVSFLVCTVLELTGLVKDMSSRYTSRRDISFCFFLQPAFVSGSLGRRPKINIKITQIISSKNVTSCSTYSTLP